MERHVQERLVGAAVLMAAAIILIPEMLSGPRRESTTTATAPQAAGDTPLKTYTIDLNRSPGASVEAPIDERAPPQEQSATAAPAAPTPIPQTLSQNARESTQTSPESAAPTSVQLPPPAMTESREPPVVQSRLPAPVPAAVAQTPPPVASAPAVPTSRGWAVQVGSFASRATADRIVKDLAGQGQTAFVMPVKSSGSTLYRVRIGPFAQRDAANDALREVKGKVANAAVVAHP